MPKAQGSDNNPACLLPALQDTSTLCLKISLVPYSCLKTPVRQETGISCSPEPPGLGQAGTWAAWQLRGGLEAWMWPGLWLPLSEGLVWVLGQDTLVLREHQAWLWCSSPHAAFVCSHPQKEGIRPSPKSSKARGSEGCLHHTKSKSSLSWAKQSLEITFFAHGKSPCPSPDRSGNPCSQGRWTDPRPPEGHKAPGVFARQRAKWVLKSGLYYSSIPISSSVSGGKIRPLIYFANVLLGMTPHPAAGGGCGKQGFF